MNCQTPYCRNTLKSGKFCSKCRKRKQRKENPFRYFYNQHKQKAKQRGILWLLTLEEFRQLWLQEPKKWREKISNDTCHWEIDRIKNNLPYQVGNVQLIEKIKNIRKYHDEDKFIVDAVWNDYHQPKTNEAPF